MGTLKVIYWNLMSMHRRRETSRKETYDKDIVEKAINDNKNCDEINVDETLVVRSPRHVKKKDHGISDISLLRTLRHLDLLPEAYLENRQGHLLINLCKGVASMEFANDRLCFIEFVQFIFNAFKNFLYKYICLKFFQCIKSFACIQHLN